MYNALVIEQQNNHYRCRLVARDESTLPPGDVTVAVEYSSLNYKDALAVTGRGPIIRQFPMVPGIDLAGTVTHSEHADWQPGAKVLLTGWGVGEKHPGGLAQLARVKGEWLVPLPPGMSSWQAMAYGTAGFTAMLCVDALVQHGVKPEDGPVLVTGASGGVGSYAVALLARLGYGVTASTGRPQAGEGLLKILGARETINRDQLSMPGKPLRPERWAAAIDTVGSHTLYSACASVRYGAVVAACGMAQGLDFPASVAPFILRGVTLVGIDSVAVPAARRVALWQRLGELTDKSVLRAICQTCPLAEVTAISAQLLDGKVRGRRVIDCQA